MKVKIRRATKKDLPQLVKLWRKFMKYHLKLSPFYMKLVRNAHREWIKYMKAKKLGKKNSVVFVAVKDKKLIGYATANVKKNKPIYKLKRYGVFGSFFVLSEYRGKGIGTMLKNKVFEWFKSKKIKHVEIGIMVGNERVKKLYERWGFKDYSIDMRRKL